uniref:Origin recognition complex subunit 3 n=1 Tax=Oncorhynchus mykiss TaxID=8022 RepID=A0A8C7NT98_ONCMY
MKATRKLPKPTQSTSSHCNNFKDGAVVKLEAETIVSPNDAHSLDGNCNSAETVKVSPPKPVQTKGCFVFKPSANKRRKTPTVEDYFTHGCEDTENSKLRFRNCQTLWEKMKADTELLQDELNRKILDSLLAFIRKSVSTFQRGTDDWASRMRAHEIPTAALVLGVNVPDHDMTFQCLSDQLQQSVTPFVVSVQATECAALNHMLQRVLERLMGTSVSVDNEEEPEQRSTNVNQKRVHCSLITLCNWYKTVTKVCSYCKEHPPIVVIFKDLEAFNPKVLQDFILICSRYVEQLPLMFVFGIATSPSTIQHMLPHSVSSLLGIELFQSLSCTQHLASVIDKVILTSQFPFKLNGKVLQVLVSIFLYHDFSVRNFINGLQLALLEHFHSQPLSVLCCKEAAALVHATELSHRDVERLQQLPSFMRYVEEQGPQEQVELLTSDDHVKEVCQKLLKDLCKYHKNYYPTLRCLHILTASLPKYPLGKQIRELHISCLEKNVWENDEYVSAMQLLRMMAKDELTSALQKCAEILKSVKTKKMRATLLEMKTSRRTKKMSQFEILRDQALEFIDSLVRSHLAPPESQPLYEVCYYSSSAVLRRHLNATPRTSIQTALSNPYHYLKNEDLRAEDGTVSNAAPDICIVYKLHLECGRLINLYDWLEAYATVVSAAEGKDPDSADFGKVDELKHARFIQAVSELEFLGFIKSTKQKTDHVSRLTWGGC